jgi:hypothetical protein
VSMTSGTALSKIIVGGSLVSFKWLKDQKMLKEGSTPRCVKPAEIYPDFLDTVASEENEPHFSEDGVFVHELKYYRHGAYCVDGELDSVGDKQEAREEGDDGEQNLSYIKVMLCEEKGRSMGGCKDRDQTCHHRYAWDYPGDPQVVENCCRSLE